MVTKKEIKPAQQGETDLAAGATNKDVPRKLTFAENAILTIKLLVGFALLGTALWQISQWTSVK
jgi:hypothetical protein